MIALLCGDVCEVLDRLPAESMDSLVSDFPYGLSREPDMVEVLRHWLAAELREHARDVLDGLVPACDVGLVASAMFPDEPYRHRGGGFMGKAWDSFVPGPEVWRSIYRVLKPGAYGVVFGGTRTYDLLVLGARIAGFEIRDQLDWLYGSGFPKSLDVSKAIDKIRDDSADVRGVCRWLRARMDERGLSSAQVAEHFGFHSRMVDHWAARDTDSQPTLPTLEQWDRLREILGFGEDMDAEVLRLNLRKGEPGDAWADRPAMGLYCTASPGVTWTVTSRDGLRRDTPTTDAAKRHAGRGTALKPAHEPIVLVRKPLAGTVAANVLRYGTGAINVDGCRVEAVDGPAYAAKGASVDGNASPRTTVAYADGNIRRDSTSDLGRWPANVILDPDAAAILDEQAGGLRARGNKTAKRTRSNADPVALRSMGERIERANPLHNAPGGASRFFYTAKAATKEREAGLAEAGAPLKSGGQLTDREDGTAGLKSPRAGAGRGGGRRNPHPTVKPLELVRWLARLVTPPGGTVCVPFSGVGSEAIAAALEGFHVVAVDIGPEYVTIAKARAGHWLDRPDLTEEARAWWRTRAEAASAAVGWLLGAAGAEIVAWSKGRAAA